MFNRNSTVATETFSYRDRDHKLSQGYIHIQIYCYMKLITTIQGLEKISDLVHDDGGLSTFSGTGIRNLWNSSSPKDLQRCRENETFIVTEANAIIMKYIGNCPRQVLSFTVPQLYTGSPRSLTGAHNKSARIYNT